MGRWDNSTATEERQGQPCSKEKAPGHRGEQQPQGHPHGDAAGPWLCSALVKSSSKKQKKRNLAKSPGAPAPPLHSGAVCRAVLPHAQGISALYIALPSLPLRIRLYKYLQGNDRNEGRELFAASQDGRMHSSVLQLWKERFRLGHAGRMEKGGGEISRQGKTEQVRSRGGTGARGAQSRGRAVAAPCQAVPHGGLSKPELGLLPPPAPSPCSGLGLTVRARFPREPAPSRASAHALGSLEQSGTGRSDTNPALANCHRWHAGGGDEGRGCPINKYAYNKSEMLEQRCRRKWVLRKKAAKPPPVPRATPRCSPPSAHLRAGLGHPLALPGPRGLPGAGRAVTTGLVTAHAPLSKACSQLPLAAALPPAGTRRGHNRDTAGMGSGRSAAPMGVAVGTRGGLLASSSTARQRG